MIDDDAVRDLPNGPDGKVGATAVYDGCVWRDGYKGHRQRAVQLSDLRLDGAGAAVADPVFVGAVGRIEALRPQPGDRISFRCRAETRPDGSLKLTHLSQVSMAERARPAGRAVMGAQRWTREELVAEFLAMRPDATGLADELDRLAPKQMRRLLLKTDGRSPAGTPLYSMDAEVVASLTVADIRGGEAGNDPSVETSLQDEPGQMSLSLGGDFGGEPLSSCELVSDVLRQLYRSFADMGPGLALVPAPTGSGKSYAASRFLAGSIVKDMDSKRPWLPAEPGRLYIYMTPLKNNLIDEKDMADAFQELLAVDRETAERAVRATCCFVRTPCDTMTRLWREKGPDWFDSVAARWPSKEGMPRELWENLTVATQKLAEREDDPLPDAVDDQRSNERLSEALRAAESQLRSAFKASYVLLKETGEDGSVKRRRVPEAQVVAQIEADASLAPWVFEVWPQALLSRCRVVVLNVHKTTFHIDRVISKQGFDIWRSDRPGSDPSNSEVRRGDVVLVDEFDSVKDTLLSILCERNAKAPLDLDHFLAVIRRATASEDASRLPTSMLPDKDRPPEGMSATERTAREQWDRLADDIEGLYKDVHGWNTPKLATGRPQGEFLWNDGTNHTVTAKSLDVLSDDEGRKNWIADTGGEGWKRPGGWAPLCSAASLVGRLRSCVERTYYTLLRVAENYMTNVNRAGSADDAITLEQSFRSVLDVVGFKGRTDDESPERAHLMNLFHDRLASGSNYPRGTVEDLTVYGQGVSYSHIEDSLDHNERSYIANYSAQATPQAMMESLCERCCVIGISATAAIDGPEANFSLTRLRRALGPELWHEIPDDLMARLEKAYGAEKAAWSEGVEVRVEPVSLGSVADVDAMIARHWERFHGQAPTAAEVAAVRSAAVADMRAAAGRRQQGARCGGKEYDPTYDLLRLMRICDACLRFLGEPRQHSMAAYTTKGASYGRDPTGRQSVGKVLEAVTGLRCLDGGAPASFNLVAIPDSKTLRREYGRVRERLLSDPRKKTVVMVCDKTGGVGVNMQYSCDQDDLPFGLVRVRPYGNRAQKDFDAFYVERPTFIAPKVDARFGPCAERDPLKRSKATIDALYRLGCLHQAGELSAADHRGASRSVFTGDYRGAPLDRLPAARRRAERNVMQVCGRALRTPCKAPVVSVFFDAGGIDLEGRRFWPGLQDVCDTAHMRGPLATPLTEALADAIEAERAGQAAASAVANRSLALCAKGCHDLASFVGRFQGARVRGTLSDQNMRTWDGIRGLELRHNSFLDEEGIGALSGSDAMLAGTLFFDIGFVADGYQALVSDDYSQVYAVAPLGGTLPPCGPGTEHPRARPQRFGREASRFDEVMAVPGVKAAFEEKGWATEYRAGRFLLTPMADVNFHRGVLGEEPGKIVLAQRAGIELVAPPDGPLKPVIFERFDAFSPDVSSYAVDFKHWSGALSKDEAGTFADIVRKLDACGTERALVCNLLKPEGTVLAPRIDNASGRVMTVPYLWDAERGRFMDNWIECAALFLKGAPVAEVERRLRSDR